MGRKSVDGWEYTHAHARTHTHTLSRFRPPPRMPQVNRDTRDTLWHAIVGLTDLLVHQRVEHAQYRQLVEGLEVEVRASQPSAEPQVGRSVGIPACLSACLPM